MMSDMMVQQQVEEKPEVVEEEFEEIEDLDTPEVEDVYIKISEKFGLTTGDVSPEDSLLADKFKESLIRYIKYNRNEREKLISEGFKNVDNDFYLKSNGDGIFIVTRIDLEKIDINLTYYSEEEIKDDTHKGDEEEDQYPCHRLGGLTIVHQDGDDSRNGYHDIKQQIYPVKINHIAFLLLNL
jgi:hypothetical protein